MAKQGRARSIEERFEDHFARIRFNHPNKSAIAPHGLIDGHENVNIENLKQLRQVNDERRFVFSATNLARATKD